MAIRNRKLFPALSTVNVTVECSDFCDPACPYNCPDYFFSPPPPLPQSPPPRLKPMSASTRAGQDNHIPPSLIITVSLVSAFFLLVGLMIAKSCSWWQSRTNQPPGIAAVDGTDGDFLDENHVDHHIWFIASIGLQQSIINAIAVCRYKKGDGLIEGTGCSVCLNEFQDGETLRLLPKCSHAFHIHCIDTWLRSHTNCPLCRANIVSGTANLNPVDPTLESLSQNQETPIENSLENVEESGEIQERNGILENRTATEDEDEDEDEEILQANGGQGISKVTPKLNGPSSKDQSAGEETDAANRSVSTNYWEAATLCPTLRKSRSAKDHTPSMQVLVSSNGTVGGSRSSSSSSSFPMTRSNSCSDGFVLSRHGRSTDSVVLP